MDSRAVTHAENSPLDGIAFHIDTVSGNFYRVATQFMGAEPALSLAYVGKETNHYPNYLARWKGAEIPGGAPQSSGWQKIAIAVQDSQAEIYWNGTKLPGGPFSIDHVQSGLIGIYPNFVGVSDMQRQKLMGSVCGRSKIVNSCWNCNQSQFAMQRHALRVNSGKLEENSLQLS